MSTPLEMVRLARARDLAETEARWAQQKTEDARKLFAAQNLPLDKKRKLRAKLVKKVRKNFGSCFGSAFTIEPEVAHKDLPPNVRVRVVGFDMDFVVYHDSSSYYGWLYCRFYCPTCQDLVKLAPMFVDHIKGDALLSRIGMWYEMYSVQQHLAKHADSSQ